MLRNLCERLMDIYRAEPQKVHDHDIIHMVDLQCIPHESNMKINPPQTAPSVASDTCVGVKFESYLHKKPLNSADTDAKMNEFSIQLPLDLWGMVAYCLEFEELINLSKVERDLYRLLSVKKYYFDRLGMAAGKSLCKSLYFSHNKTNAILDNNYKRRSDDFKHWSTRAFDKIFVFDGDIENPYFWLMGTLFMRHPSFGISEITAASPSALRRVTVDKISLVYNAINDEMECVNALQCLMRHPKIEFNYNHLRMTTDIRKILLMATHRNFDKKSGDDCDDRFVDLHFSVAHNNLNAVQRCFSKLQRSTDANCEALAKGYTPLYLAAANDWSLYKDICIRTKDKTNEIIRNKFEDERHRIIEYLLRNGANIDKRLRNGDSPLMIAAKYGLISVAKLLIRNGAHINGVNKRGMTPLLIAVKSEQLPMVKLLISNGANIAHRVKPTKTAFDALAFAYLNNDLDTMTHLIESGNGDTEVNNRYQWQCRHGKCTTLLLQTIDSGSYLTSVLLIENGANVDATDHLCQTPLFKTWRPTVAQILVEKGCDIHWKDKFGNTALHWNAYKGELTMVQYLTKLGSDINATDNRGKTAIICAAKRGNYRVIEFLLSQKADIDISDIHGRTALIMATIHSWKSVVGLLVSNGADLNKKCKVGRTALAWAHMRGYIEIANILQTNGARLD